MTDVAFLVIIFFGVATSIPTEKGIPMTLPKAAKIDRDITHCGESAFLLRILINNQNKILINDEESSISKVNGKIKSRRFYSEDLARLGSTSEICCY